MPIEDDIRMIQERNARVDADKAWETSLTRKILILFITYVLATSVMWVIGVDMPYINALIPTLGYFLSTLSLRFAKKYWLEKFFLISNPKSLRNISLQRNARLHKRRRDGLRNVHIPLIHRGRWPLPAFHAHQG